MGLAHAVKAPLSRLHSKLLPASSDVKLKLALVLLLSAGGDAVIVVLGALVSITGPINWPNANGNDPTNTVCVTVFVDVSMTDTVLLPKFAT